MSPSVTVVIAAFKATELLRAAIMSALRQTFTDFELIVSDDADDPGVRALAGSFGDPRVRYRTNAMRLGPAGNHWAAFADARGEFLAILNHDDLLDADFLAKLVPELRTRPEAVVAFCDHHIIDHDSRPLTAEADKSSIVYRRTSLGSGLHRPFFELVVYGTIPIAMGAVIRRSALDLSTLADVAGAYDLYLAYRLASPDSGAVYVPQRLTSWRLHQGQISGGPNIPWTLGSLHCWQHIARDPNYAEFRQRISSKLADAEYQLARSFVTAGNARKARQYARQSVAHSPWRWRGWAVVVGSHVPFLGGLVRHARTQTARAKSASPTSGEMR